MTICLRNTNAHSNFVFKMAKILLFGRSFVRDKLFGKYLFVTNICIGGVMMTAGDYIQQNIEIHQGRSNCYNVERAGHMCCIGLVLAPIQHVIYKNFEKFWPGKDLRTVVKKLTADQMIVAPICIGTFFLGVNFLEGKDMALAVKELRQKFLTAYVVDCALWVPCQMINFFYLPAKFRVLYVNFIFLGYNVFLSYIKYKDKKEDLS